MKKWLNIKPKVNDFSEDEVDTETESEDDGVLIILPCSFFLFSLIVFSFSHLLLSISIQLALLEVQECVKMNPPLEHNGFHPNSHVKDQAILRSFSAICFSFEDKWEKKNDSVNCGFKIV